MIIYLMRHGTTSSNINKIYAGRSFENLSPKGISLLIKKAKKLRKIKIDKIYTSPIQRAIQSARIVNRFLNKDIEIEENLREMDLGEWEGLSESQVAVKFPKEWKIWNSKPSLLMTKERESLTQLLNRALVAISNIKKSQNFEKKQQSSVLAVTHVAVIRVLLIHFNKLNLDDYRKIDIPNGSVWKLDAENGRIFKIF